MALALEEREPVISAFSPLRTFCLSLIEVFDLHNFGTFLMLCWIHKRRQTVSLAPRYLVNLNASALLRQVPSVL